jgi:hypothetical protein
MKILYIFAKIFVCSLHTIKGNKWGNQVFIQRYLRASQSAIGDHQSARSVGSEVQLSIISSQHARYAWSGDPESCSAQSSVSEAELSVVRECDRALFFVHYVQEREALRNRSAVLGKIGQNRVIGCQIFQVIHDQLRQIVEIRNVVEFLVHWIVHSQIIVELVRSQVERPDICSVISPQSSCWITKFRNFENFQINLSKSYRSFEPILQ